MPDNARTPLRVVQWSIGNIGARALKAVIEHPRLELAGVYTHSADKAGRDAGDLCGAPATGVKATSSLDEVIALKPDCVLYMQQGTDFDDLCRLLEAGINVVTTRGDFHNPAAMDPAVRARVEAACAKGRASIHSTGSSPGFVSEHLPLALLLLQRRLDRLTIDEYADLSQRNSPDLLFNHMGYGQPPAAFDERRLAPVRANFSDTLSLIASSLGTPLDSFEVFGEVATADHPIRIAAGVIEPGTIAAQRITVAGLRGGEPYLQFRANWYCSREVEVDWDLRETGWRVQVEGDTPLDVSIRFPIPLERYGEVMPGLTAHPAVNSITVVCAAEPGIRTSLDLAKVVPDFGPA